MRRHPLTVNGWARTAETPPRICRLISVRTGPLGVRYWTVRFPGSYQGELIEGMLEFVPGAYAE